MADINTTLGLDLDEALRDLDRLGDAIDRALGTVEIRLDAFQAQRQLDQLAQDADRALGDVDVNIDSSGAAQLNDELAQAERNLTDAEREARQLERTVGRVDNEARQVDNTTKGMAGNFANLEKAAKGVIAAFAALGVGQLFGTVIRNANAAIQSFAVLEDSVNAVNVIFGTAAASVLEFGETAAQSAGLSESAFNQAVTPLGALLQNFGFDAREAADASVVLVQRAADLASVLGGDVQTALAAVSSALRGQSEPLTAYGATISAARVEQFALANGLAATKSEITDAITLQARYGLILEDTSRVAGDYAATAGDLANAQRTAGGEAVNFGADIGEVLAPAMEVLVGLVPELLEGLRQLVPGFANAADSAASFFESINEGSGFRAPLQAIGAGLGLVGDSFSGIADVASGVFSVLQLDFDAAGDQAEQFGARFARAAQRVIGQNLARQLDSGTDAVTAFGNSISAFGRQEENLAVFAETFRTFAIQANLSGQELAFVTGFLIDNAAAAGFSADEIQFLNEQLALLNSTLFTDIEAVRQFNAETRELAEGGLNTATTTFTTFAGATESAQERASNALTQLAADAEAQATRTAAAFDLFAELPEKITGSFTAAVDALREQVEASFDFDVNLAILRALNLDALADEFQSQGIAAAGQLAQAVNDIPEAIEADRLLQGFSDLGTDAFNALVKQFIDAGLTPADAQRLARTLSSPEVIDAAEEAGKSVGAAQAESYHDQLTEDLDQLIPEIGESIGRSVETHWALEEQADTAARDTAQSYVDGIIGFNIDDRIQEIFESVSFVVNLFDVGADSASSYVAGFQEELASRQDDVTSAITGTLDTAIQRDSPPKLFLDAGKESGAAFWSGFEEAGLGPLRTPETGVTGTMVNTTAAANTGSGINVSLTTINPTQQDEVSDVARMGQIASSIAASYRSVVPNGM